MSRRGSTKHIKDVMYQLYGKRCMLCNWKPKGHTKHKTSKKYLTYHHIHEYSKGGETSIENGAILCNHCHEWFNKQTKAKQKALNAEFQRIKRKSKCN